MRAQRGQGGQVVPDDPRLVWLRNVQDGRWENDDTIKLIRSGKRTSVSLTEAFQIARTVYSLNEFLSTGFLDDDAQRVTKAGKNVIHAFLTKSPTYVNHCLTVGKVLKLWEDKPEWAEFRPTLAKQYGMKALAEKCEAFAIRHRDNAHPGN